jgi:hypothetical protein
MNVKIVVRIRKIGCLDEDVVFATARERFAGIIMLLVTLIKSSNDVKC